MNDGKSERAPDGQAETQEMPTRGYFLHRASERSGQHRRSR
jgi:hypothetical protein